MIERIRMAGRNFWRGAPWESRAHRGWFRFCSVCLSLYIAYVTFLAYSPLLKGVSQTLLSIGWYAAYAVFLYGLQLFLCGKWAERAPKRGRERERLSPGLFWVATGLALAVAGFSFLACYPGLLNYDATNQWQQAQTGEFNNWHPVFHTLLIWLVTRVCNSYWFVVAVQIAAFAAAAGYLTATLHRHGVPAWLALTIQTLVAASPPVRNCLMYVGKDSAMTIGALVLCAQSVRMMLTKGAWLGKARNAVAFGLMLAFTSLVRHNAILYTLPLLLFAVLGFRGFRRMAALSACVMAVCMALTQGPLFSALDIVYPNNTVEESVGIPMAIMGNVKKSNPEALNEETATFLSALATDEEWQTVYRKSDYNSIKFTFEREQVAFTPIGKLLRMTWQTVASDPRTAFETVNDVTSLVWGVADEGRGAVAVRVPDGWRRVLFELLDVPMAIGPLKWVLQNIGVQQLLLLLAALWALYRGGVRTLMLTLPVLLYNLGTMLLLCGNDARFFQFSMALCLPSILALLYTPAVWEHKGRTSLGNEGEPASPPVN